ncbi:hypothetical protein [Nocardia wallacei]|uniref:hypothetical protein n=1 Tax=Nocardia wallacei TaxID=480035 RepID=UPI002458BBF1|nr:hypothetical protein [Nocardia wallacei]
MGVVLGFVVVIGLPLAVIIGTFFWPERITSEGTSTRTPAEGGAKTPTPRFLVADLEPSAPAYSTKQRSGACWFVRGVGRRARCSGF